MTNKCFICNSPALAHGLKEPLCFSCRAKAWDYYKKVMVHYSDREDYATGLDRFIDFVKEDPDILYSM